MGDQMNDFKVALDEANVERAAMADQLTQANASLDAIKQQLTEALKKADA